MNVAIIPARGGSVRIPRKNIRLFHGKPIIAYSIEAAKLSGLFDHILVSTDDDEIAEIAYEYGAGIVRRGPELAGPYVGTQEVTRHAIEGCERDVEFVCCIYATAPLMSALDLVRGRECLSGIGILKSDYAYSVGGSNYPFQDAGQFYWGRTQAFLDGLPLGSCAEPTNEDGCGVTTLVHISNRRVCDINTEHDWRRAEEMYAALYGTSLSGLQRVGVGDAHDSAVAVEKVQGNIAGSCVHAPDRLVLARGRDLIASGIATGDEKQDK